PEADALREAAFFVERLESEQMPLAGLVLNRATSEPAPGLSVEGALAAAERLGGSDGMAAALLRLHAERLQRVDREHALRRRFAAAHPSVATAAVLALDTDVHDVDALRRIGELLAA
ncbi:MAG: ArsA family ATPase, partial [Nocardioidaceae bacterium]